MIIFNMAGIYFEKSPETWLAIAERCLERGIAKTACWYGTAAPAYQSMVEQAGARNNGRLVFPGPLPNAELLKKISSGQYVLLIASVIEVFPMAIMEACSLAIPVVCRRFPGYEEVLGADYPYSFGSVEEAVELFVNFDHQKAKATAQLLFRERFCKNDSWYAELAELFDSL